MAEISFKGFVEPKSGRGPLTIVEQHRRKNDADEWVTEARTYHRVWPPRDAPEPPEGALVAVVGKQKTTKYDKDGETKYSLIVQADSIQLVERGRFDAAPTPSDDSDVPF